MPLVRSGGYNVTRCSGKVVLYLKCEQLKINIVCPIIYSAACISL